MLPVLSGYSWITLFHQDAIEGGMFPYGTGSNRKQVDKFNENDPLAARYSILYRMEEFRGKDGMFHLRFCFPEYSEPFPCNEWKQSSNFLTETEILDYTKIENTYDNNYGSPFPGLKKMTSWYKNYFLYSPYAWCWGIGYGYGSGGTRFRGAFGKPWVTVADLYIAGGRE